MGDAHAEEKRHSRALGLDGRAATRERRSAALRRVSVWLVISDAASLVLSWLLALGLLRFFAPGDWWQGVVAWWSDSGESRAAQFFLLLALMLVLFVVVALLMPVINGAGAVS